MAAQVLNREGYRTIALGVYDRDAAFEFASPNTNRSIVPASLGLSCALPIGHRLTKIALAKATGIIFVKPDLRAIRGTDMVRSGFAGIIAVVHQRHADSVTHGTVRRGVIWVGTVGCETLLI